MPFDDYSKTPSANQNIGDGIFIGPNMDRNKVRLALQQLAADGRSLADVVNAATLPNIETRAGMYFAFDADGNPIASTGTGADAGLRTDLAETTGGALVKLLNGRSVEGEFTARPRRISYGVRRTPRSYREAFKTVGTLSANIVGFAGYAGTTGGAGYPVYYVNDPSLDETVKYSFGWALAQVALSGGGNIIFDPTGVHTVILNDRIVLTAFNNVTMWAPGRNVTFWTNRLKGIFNISGVNLIFEGLDFRPLAGPINGTVIGTDESTAKTLVSIQSDKSDKIAFINCEFRHPSWHCLDITRATGTDGSDPCRVSVQNCIFWDAIQGHLIGTLNSHLGPGDPDGEYTTDASVREIFVTFHECIWAYNLQRNPKVLGNAYVDVVDCLGILRPYEVEYLDGTTTYPEIHLSAFGGAVQEGGWLRVRGSLYTSAHSLIDGQPATELVVGYSGNTGRIAVEDSAAENLVFKTRDAALIDALPYTLPHTPVPPAGAGREAWVMDLWERAGARPDAAPQGLFVPLTDPDAIPNGETVVLDLTQRTDRTKLLERVDEMREYALPSIALGEVPLSTPRGVTRVVGKDEGRSTGTAINPAVLDVTGLLSSYMIVNGNGGASDLRHVVTKNDGELTDGVILKLSGSSAYPVTLKTARTFSGVTVAALAADTLTVAGHGETASGFQVVMSNTGGALPGGLASLTPYFGVYVDANTFKLAPTYQDALAGTNIVDLTSAGTGSQFATIGSFDIPRDIILKDTAQIVELTLNSATQRFSVSTGIPADAGPYTPVLAAVTNVSSVSLDSAYYERNGNGVTVHVRLQVTPTAVGSITVGIPFPVATTITSTNDVIGHGVSSSGSGIPAYVTGATSFNRANLTLTATGTSTITVFASFRYPIK